MSYQGTCAVAKSSFTDGLLTDGLPRLELFPREADAETPLLSEDDPGDILWLVRPANPPGTDLQQSLRVRVRVWAILG